VKYPRSKAVAKAGVLFVEEIVNRHGSVFRPVHQEDDFGIDGFIELVAAEEVTGRLIAVQVKAGDSYLSQSGCAFEVAVDQRHLDYWMSFMVPVILVCHSPSKEVAAWISIRDYVEHEEYQESLPVTSIEVPFHRAFSVEALSKGIAGLAHLRADERLLLRAADKCLSTNADVRLAGFQTLSQHPDSRKLKITCLMAARLLLEDNAELAKEALFSLGYGVGRGRWSWNPNNRDEHEIIWFAGELASNLSAKEIRRVIELVDDEEFHGPDALGERCFDILCCSELAQTILWKIASDKAEPMIRRANCIYMIYECDYEAVEEAAVELGVDSEIADVVAWLLSYAEAKVESPG